MIYKEIHTIPARLFFHILESGDISQLDTEIENFSATEENTLENHFEELKNIWLHLEDEDQRLSKNPSTNKFLDVSKQIESLKCKQKKIEISIEYLRIKDDDELRELLENDGYQIGEDLEKDLAKIERFNKDLNVQIGKLELQLPKPKEQSESVPFDEIVIGFGIVVGQAFRPNEITQSEFRALENSVRKKLEILDKNGAKR